MALINIEIPEPTITDVANDIRQMLASVVNLADIRLQNIRTIVRDHGRAAIAAELGSDAAAMLTVYAKLKEAIEAAKQITVEDLPN